MSMNRTRLPVARRMSDTTGVRVLSCEPTTHAARMFSSRSLFCWILLAFVFPALVCDRIASAQLAKPDPKNEKGKKEKKDKNPPKDDLQVDPEKLPPGFQPPPERFAIMDLELPIASKEELDKLNKESLPKWFKVKNDCDLSPAGRKVVQDSIRYKLAVMTLKDMPNRGAKEEKLSVISQLPALHKRFIDELQNVGHAAVRPQDRALFVEFLGKEVVRQIPELLKNNFYVRLHATMILGEMDYAGGYELLLQIIQAKDIRVDEANGQPEAVKIAAAMGLIRIVRYASPPPIPKDKNIIAHAVVEELKKQDAHWWYQLRLLEVLRYCDIAGVDPANNNKPFVVECLLEVIKDQKRTWYVRAKACYVLGRVPLPPSVNTSDVVATVADFALELTNAASAKPNNPGWKSCFWDLYLTFRPNDKGNDKDVDAERKLSGGFLARIKPTATPLYNLVVPLVSDVLNDKVPNAGSRQSLDNFIKTTNQAGRDPKRQNPNVPEEPQNGNGPNGGNGRPPGAG